MTQQHFPDVDCCERHSTLNVTLHRIDVDLELSVCNRCGQGRVQDLSSWTKMSDAMGRMNEAMNRLERSLKQMNVAIEKTKAME